MGLLLQSTNFFQGFILDSFRISISSKSLHLRQVTLMLLFCLGGDADSDFVDKNFASAKNSHVHALFLSKVHKPLITASTDYFRSRQSGNWSAPATWESSPDNTNWQVATEVPTKDANTITIQNGYTVSVSISVSLDQTVIVGLLELQTGGILNINDSAGDDVTIAANGVLQIATTNTYANAIQQNGNPNIHIATNGKILIGNGVLSVGDGYESLATSLVNIWDDGSVYEYNNNGVFAISGLTYFPNATASEIPIFRVTKVNGPINAGANKDLFVNGIFESNTSISFTGNAKKYFRNGIRGNATITQTGGKFYLGLNPYDVTAYNAVLDGTSLKIVLSQPIDLSPTSTIVPVGANVTITGANINNTPTNPPNSHGDLTINGTLDVTTVNITNTGTSMIVINGTYRTAHPRGFSGPSSSIPSTTGIIKVNPGSTIELYASGPQSLNTRTDFGNLILSGSGSKTPNGPFNPAGTIIIKDDAIFDCTGVVNGINIGDDNTNLTMSGNSRLIVSSVNMNPKMGGAYNLTGGVIEFRGSLGTPQTIRSKNYQNIEVTGTNVLMSGGNITLNNMGTFKVKNGGVFAINDNTINGPSGTQTVTVESGGLFKCGTVKGFHGFTLIPTPIISSAINSDIENIILQPNSTVEYSRAQPPLSSGDQPITTVNGLIYQNLILSGTGNKTAPTGDLIIQGNLSKTGSCTFVHNDGTVIFNGTAAQSYDATSPLIVFNNLTNKNNTALNVNSGLSVYKTLLLDDNSKINLNADITLKSDQNRTANVAKIPANVMMSYNAGRFVAERYINSGSTAGNHGKSWQLLSAPAFGETIFNTWQEHGDNAITGFGTWITDPSGIANGFDGISISPSVKKFNVFNQSWEGIASTNIPVSGEGGYFVYVRGDRTVRGIATSANPATLRVRGELFRGSQPAITVGANSYQSIANPYPSAVDFSKLITSNIGNSFYVWDPSIGGNYGAGGYQTIAASTGYIAVPGASSIFTSNTDYRNIQSGQAFMVHNSSAFSGSVQFTEDCKMADGHHLVHREGTERQMLFANLYNKDGLLTDGNAVVFDEDFSNNIDGDDAVKMQDSNENFGIARNNKTLAIEARQPVSRPDTVFYDLRNLKQKEYRLVFIPKNLSTELSAVLTDRFLKTETKLSLSDSTFFDFSVTSDPASYAADRFSVAFLPAIAAAQLPVTFISITAQISDKNVLVEWKVENENNVHHYEIEHSVDGIHFLLIEIRNASGMKDSLNSYTDNSPVSGNNFYRLRSVDKNGKSLISPVVKVFLATFKSGISIYPNPVNGEIIHLRFIGQQVGNYSLTLYNSSGEVLQTKTLYHADGSENHSLKINTNFPTGIYIIEINGPGKIKEFLKVVK